MIPPVSLAIRPNGPNGPPAWVGPVNMQFAAIAAAKVHRMGILDQLREPRPRGYHDGMTREQQAAHTLSISALTASSASGVSMSTSAAVSAGTSTTASP